jgi:hypothetical protein
MGLTRFAGLVAAPLAAEEVPWTEIPAVRLLGLVVGGALLLIAIKSMFGGNGSR